MPPVFSGVYKIIAHLKYITNTTKANEYKIFTIRVSFKDYAIKYLDSPFLKKN